MNGRFINILAIELVIYTLVHDLTIVQFNLKKQSQANVLSKFQPMISGQVTSQINIDLEQLLAGVAQLEMPVP